MVLQVPKLVPLLSLSRSLPAHVTLRFDNPALRAIIQAFDENIKEKRPKQRTLNSGRHVLRPVLGELSLGPAPHRSLLSVL